MKRKMKNFKKLIILISIINYAQLIQSYNELLELNCDDDRQCRQFEHSGIKASCLKEQCECFTSNRDSVKCQPLSPKVSNIVGGICPCKIPNADCDTQQDICYCISKFIPSKDKRRCIPKTVALGEKCEEDSQCQKGDFNAICHESECRCMDQFVSDEGKCLSILGNKSFPKNDSQCQKEYGPNTKYSLKNELCICKADYFASIDNSQCLKTLKYLENCTEKLQCIGTMGLGGKCTENGCQCSEKYYVEEKKNDEGVIKTVCTAIVERGEYCRLDEDCYQRQLNEMEQSMHCSYGECNCKDGYYSYNEGDCIKGSGGNTKSSWGMKIMIFILINVLVS